MKIYESMIQKVQEKLETEARDNVLSMMGHIRDKVKIWNFKVAPQS